MPLVKTGGKASIGPNIKKLTEEGKPRKQAIAISLDVARRSGTKIPAIKKPGMPGKFRGR